MSDFVKLEGSSLKHIAKDITISAIENNLFSQSESSEDTAKDIANFYKTLCTELGSPDN